MPRRGGRERYRTPKEAARATDYSSPREWVPRTEFSARMNGRAFIKSTVVQCTHDVPWTTCAVCSKPKGPR